MSATAARRNTLLILAVATAARLLVLASALRNPPHWFFQRGMEMGLLAHSLLSGHGLSSPFGPPTGPTAFIAPAYPLIVAAVFHFFGEFSRASEIFILLAQTALNLITIALMMRIAHRLFNERTAVLAGILWAISLPLLWIPTIFWETSLSCCLLTALLAFALDSPCKPAQRTWPLAGAFCGIIGLVNPALLPASAAIALWIWLRSRRTAKAWPLAALLTFAIVFSAWPIRNARTFHAFIPTRTTVGYELWMGNRPNATGYLDESLFPTFNQGELNDYTQRGELGYVANKSTLARQWIAAHPGSFTRLTLGRILRFWTGTGTRGGSPIFALHASLVSFFAFAGLWMLYRRHGRALALLFAIPFALFPLPYYLTHAEFRYRLILDPLLSVAAAYAVSVWYEERVAENAAELEALDTIQLEGAS